MLRLAALLALAPARGAGLVLHETGDGPGLPPIRVGRGRRACEAAYALYSERRGLRPDPDPERADYFCGTVGVLLDEAAGRGDSVRQARHTAVYGITPFADRPPPASGFIPHNGSERVAGRAPTECNMLYYMPDPVLPLSPLPEAVDLREEGLCTQAKDQEKCGSCWAFGAVALMEAAVLYDRAHYSASTRYEPYFDEDATSLGLSEQFVLNTSTSGNNNYCSGGNFVYAVFDLAHRITPTAELTSNFPYTAGSGKNPGVIRFTPPIIPARALLNPFATVSVPGTVCRTAVVDLMALSRGSGPWDDTVRDAVKNYVAQGIVVAASMSTAGCGAAAQRAFSMYGAGVFDYACPSGAGLDHQIAIVGYGDYKGVPVWVMRNSWGKSWGLHGYFMVPQGSNSMCTEEYALASVPAHFDAANPRRFRASSWQRNIYDGKIRRGENGLDRDDGTFDPEVFQTTMSDDDVMLLVVAAVLAVAVVVVGVGVGVSVRRQRKAAREASAKAEPGGGGEECDVTRLAGGISQ